MGRAEDVVALEPQKRFLDTPTGRARPKPRPGRLTRTLDSVHEQAWERTAEGTYCVRTYPKSRPGQLHNGEVTYSLHQR